MLKETQSERLSREESKRLDALLSAARRFHYSAFLMSGISLALSSIESFEDFKLPVGDITVPGLQTAVGIYLTVIVLTVAAERLLAMADPWLGMDTRRPPFAWIALGTKGTSVGSATLWLFLPILICAVSTAVCLGNKDFTGSTLSFAGAFVMLLPHRWSHYWLLVKTHQDHRGGQATLSIWLLYLYRMQRGLTMIALFFAPVIAVIPRWREPVWRVALPLIYIGLSLYVLRLVAGFPLVYRRIDRLGKRFGFPITSKHYH
jgi:hypothetical protein